MRAKDLRGALNIFDPERSLRTQSELRDFFVERPMSPLADLRFLLLDTKGPQKILFTGHRGSGKSTELAKLVLELDDELFIVHYSVKSILNMFDLTYVDVILSLGLELIRKVTESNLEINSKILEQVLDFAKDITKEVEMGSITKPSLAMELNFYMVKLSSKLGTEVETREIVREKVSPRISDLIENIEFLSKEIERLIGKKILVIIEDLDKTDLDKSKKLFYENATTLLAPPVSIVYTFPIALRHDNAIMQIESNFPNFPFVLPNIKARSKEGEEDADGIERLKEILFKRVEEPLFSPEAAHVLIVNSGGIPRELIGLSRRACLEALKAGQTLINEDAALKAVKSKIRDYQVLLTSEQLTLLRKIEKTKRVENDEKHRELLHNLSALEYRNDDVWYDVHPVVKPLLAED